MQMKAVEGLLVAAENVRHNDFRKFVLRIGEDDKLRLALQWIPRIKLDERKSFEEVARRDGMAEFAIFERTALGQRLTAENRPEYYPILYTELPFFATYEVNKLTSYGMPGVWHFGFVDTWSPGYLGFAASNHNGMTRM